VGNPPHEAEQQKAVRLLLGRSWRGG
jgi:hypothetical protein